MRFNKPLNYIDKTSKANEELIPQSGYITGFDIKSESNFTMILWGEEVPVGGGDWYSISFDEGVKIKSLKIKESGIVFRFYSGLITN